MQNIELNLHYPIQCGVSITKVIYWINNENLLTTPHTSSSSSFSHSVQQKKSRIDIKHYNIYAHGSKLNALACTISSPPNKSKRFG